MRGVRESGSRMRCPRTVQSRAGNRYLHHGLLYGMLRDLSFSQAHPSRVSTLSQRMARGRPRSAMIWSSHACQYLQTSIAEARLFAGQRNQTLAQAIVVMPRLVAITRNRNQQQAAGPAFGEGELLPDVLDRCLHRCELHPFFSITDCSASLSRLRSAASLRNREFSSRSRLASCASLTSMPPYFDFQA